MDDIIMYGLTEGECGLLCILGTFVPQESHYFKESGIASLLKLGYARFNIKEKIITITDAGNGILGEVTDWKINKIRVVK